MIVLDLDRVAAFHLAQALDAWRRRCREVDGVAFPAGLDALRTAAWERARGASEGLATPRLPQLDGVAHHHRVMWLTVRVVAQALSASERQVKRWLADGALRSFRVGGSRRVHADDLAEFAHRRGGVNVAGHRIEGGEGGGPPADPPAPAPAGGIEWE